MFYLRFFEAVCMKSAFMVQRPEKLFIHSDTGPPTGRRKDNEKILYDTICPTGIAQWKLNPLCVRVAFLSRGESVRAHLFYRLLPSQQPTRDVGMCEDPFGVPFGLV